jgi:type I restriction enzyme S subunit
VSWPTVSLGDICELKYGKSLPASARDGGAVRVYGSNGPVGEHSHGLTVGPAIIIGRKGSFGEVHYSPSPCWPIDTTYYVDETSTKADLRWLAHQLSVLGLKDMNRAAAVPGLNREDAYRQRLMLPPLEEQRRIAAILDQAQQLVALRAEQLQALVHLQRRSSWSCSDTP